MFENLNGIVTMSDRSKRMRREGGGGMGGERVGPWEVSGGERSEGRWECCRGLIYEFAIQYS